MFPYFSYSLYFFHHLFLSESRGISGHLSWTLCKDSARLYACSMVVCCILKPLISFHGMDRNRQVACKIEKPELLRLYSTVAYNIHWRDGRVRLLCVSYSIRTDFCSFSREVQTIMKWCSIWS